MNRSSLLVRSTAATLATLLIAQTAFLHAEETLFLARRQKALRLAAADLTFTSANDLRLPPPVLPPAMSPLVEASSLSFPSDRLGRLVAAVPGGAGTLRHIPASVDRNELLLVRVQDIHQNADAQRNISRALRALADAGALDAIAVEGAFGPIDTSRFRAFEDQKSLSDAADFLLTQKHVGGPLHATLTARRDVPLIGIDDAPLYRSNVAAYRASLSQRPARDAELAAIDRGLEADGARLPARRKALFEALRGYAAGRVSPVDYASLLVREAGRSTPEIGRLLMAARMEASLDVKRVESERNAVLASLLPALSAEESAALLARGAAFRSGDLGTAAFYADLSTLLRRHRIALNGAPAFQHYLAYLALADSIDMDRLLADLASLEGDAIRRGASGPAERALFAEAQQWALLSKLVSFSLSSSEWRSLRTSPAMGRPRAGRFVALGPTDPFEAFYLAADARDRAMAANVQRLAARRGYRTIAVVAGGYHADGFTGALQNARTLDFIPAVQKTDDGLDYLTVFARAKTPLEELFAGRKLFLAPLVADGATGWRLALATAFLRLWLSAGSIGVGEARFQRDLRALTGEPVQADVDINRREGWASAQVDDVVSLTAFFDGARFRRDLVERWPARTMRSRLRALRTEYIPALLSLFDARAGWDWLLAHRPLNRLEAAYLLLGARANRFASWGGVLLFGVTGFEVASLVGGPHLTWAAALSAGLASAATGLALAPFFGHPINNLVNPIPQSVSQDAGALTLTLSVPAGAAMPALDLESQFLDVWPRHQAGLLRLQDDAAAWRDVRPLAQRLVHNAGTNGATMVRISFGAGPVVRVWDNRRTTVHPFRIESGAFQEGGPSDVDAMGLEEVAALMTGDRLRDRWAMSVSANDAATATPFAAMTQFSVPASATNGDEPGPELAKRLRHESTSQPERVRGLLRQIEKSIIRTGAHMDVKRLLSYLYLWNDTENVGLRAMLELEHRSDKPNFDIDDAALLSLVENHDDTFAGEPLPGAVQQWAAWHLAQRDIDGRHFPFPRTERLPQRLPLSNGRSIALTVERGPDTSLVVQVLSESLADAWNRALPARVRPIASAIFGQWPISFLFRFAHKQRPLASFTLSHPRADVADEESLPPQSPAEIAHWLKQVHLHIRFAGTAFDTAVAGAVMSALDAVLPADTELTIDDVQVASSLNPEADAHARRLSVQDVITPEVFGGTHFDLADWRTTNDLHDGHLIVTLVKRLRAGEASDSGEMGAPPRHRNLLEMIIEFLSFLNYVKTSAQEELGHRFILNITGAGVARGSSSIFGRRVNGRWMKPVTRPKNPLAKRRISIARYFPFAMAMFVMSAGASLVAIAAANSYFGAHRLVVLGWKVPTWFIIVMSIESIGGYTKVMEHWKARHIKGNDLYPLFNGPVAAGRQSLPTPSDPILDSGNPLIDGFQRMLSGLDAWWAGDTDGASLVEEMRDTAQPDARRAAAARFTERFVAPLEADMASKALPLDETANDLKMIDELPGSRVTARRLAAALLAIDEQAPVADGDERLELVWLLLTHDDPDARDFAQLPVADRQALARVASVVSEAVAATALSTPSAIWGSEATDETVTESDAQSRRPGVPVIPGGGGSHGTSFAMRAPAALPGAPRTGGSAPSTTLRGDGSLSPAGAAGRTADRGSNESIAPESASQPISREARTGPSPYKNPAEAASVRAIADRGDARASLTTPSSARNATVVTPRATDVRSTRTSDIDPVHSAQPVSQAADGRRHAATSANGSNAGDRTGMDATGAEALAAKAAASNAPSSVGTRSVPAPASASTGRETAEARRASAAVPSAFSSASAQRALGAAASVAGNLSVERRVALATIATVLLAWVALQGATDIHLLTSLRTALLSSTVTGGGLAFLFLLGLLSTPSARTAVDRDAALPSSTGSGDTMAGPAGRFAGEPAARAAAMPDRPSAPGPHPRAVRAGDGRAAIAAGARDGRNAHASESGPARVTQNTERAVRGSADGRRSDAPRRAAADAFVRSLTERAAIAAALVEWMEHPDAATVSVNDALESFIDARRRDATPRAALAARARALWLQEQGHAGEGSDRGSSERPSEPAEASTPSAEPAFSHRAFADVALVLRGEIRDLSIPPSARSSDAASALTRPFQDRRVAFLYWAAKAARLERWRQDHATSPRILTLKGRSTVAEGNRFPTEPLPEADLHVVGPADRAGGPDQDRSLPTRHPLSEGGPAGADRSSLLMSPATPESGFGDAGAGTDRLAGLGEGLSSPGRSSAQDGSPEPTAHRPSPADVWLGWTSAARLGVTVSIVVGGALATVGALNGWGGAIAAAGNGFAGAGLWWIAAPLFLAAGAGLLAVAVLRRNARRASASAVADGGPSAEERLSPDRFNELDQLAAALVDLAMATLQRGGRLDAGAFRRLLGSVPLVGVGRYRAAQRVIGLSDLDVAIVEQLIRRRVAALGRGAINRQALTAALGRVLRRSAAARRSSLALAGREPIVPVFGAGPELDDVFGFLQNHPEGRIHVIVSPADADGITAAIATRLSSLRFGQRRALAQRLNLIRADDPLFEDGDAALPVLNFTRLSSALQSAVRDGRLPRAREDYLIALPALGGSDFTWNADEVDDPFLANGFAFVLGFFSDAMPLDFADLQHIDRLLTALINA